MMRGVSSYDIFICIANEVSPLVVDNAYEYKILRTNTKMVYGGYTI